MKSRYIKQDIDKSGKILKSSRVIKSPLSRQFREVKKEFEEFKRIAYIIIFFLASALILTNWR